MELKFPQLKYINDDYYRIDEIYTIQKLENLYMIAQIISGID